MAEASRVKTVPWWVGPAFAVLALGTVPWVIFLAVTLPRHATFAHYRGVWVGFDTALVVVLALTAYLAWRGRAEQLRLLRADHGVVEGRRGGATAQRGPAVRPGPSRVAGRPEAR